MNLVETFEDQEKQKLYPQYCYCKRGDTSIEQPFLSLLTRPSQFIHNFCSVSLSSLHQKLKIGCPSIELGGENE